MEKSKIIYGISTAAGLLGGILSKSVAGKAAGFGLASVSAGLLLKEIYRKEKQEVIAQCENTEKVIEESGLDIEKVDETDLLDKEEEVIFGETLLRHCYDVFPDDMLVYTGNTLRTLHVLQNVEKNRIIISIPLPKMSQKSSIGAAELRMHFEGIFEDIIEEYKLEMQLFTNQIAVHVGKADDGFVYYSEIDREPGEKFQEYLKRVNKIMNAWDHGDKTAKEKYGEYEGAKTIGFEQYLVLEFPVFPKSSGRRGLDLISAMSLLKKLTEVMTITSGGREQEFEFEHIVFHPGDDYGTVLQVKEGKIVSIDL